MALMLAGRPRALGVIPSVYAASSVSRRVPLPLLLIVTFPRFSPFKIKGLKGRFGNPSVTLRPRNIF